MDERYIIPTDPDDDELAEWQVKQFYQWESNAAHVEDYLDTLSGADYRAYIDNLWEGHNATA